jgi:hypothetical protein
MKNLAMNRDAGMRMTSEPIQRRARSLVSMRKLNPSKPAKRTRNGCRPGMKLTLRWGMRL